jgi:hypothetical protein
LLDGNCGCQCGEDVSIATSAVVRVAATPVLDATEEFFHENLVSGVTLLMAEAPMLKWLDLTVELCTRDLELITMVTGATIHRDAGVPVGFSRPPTGTRPPNISIEIWSQNFNAPDPSAAYNRIVWPLAHLELNESEYFNGLANVKMTGTAHPNPAYRPEGCWWDVPDDVELDMTMAEHMFYDAALPTLGCGFTTDPVPCPEPV